MKNLGKFILITLLLTNTIYALSVKVSPKIVYQGDDTSFIVSAQGSEIHFPKLKEIAGYKLKSQSISRNITNINGKVTKTLSKEYIFAPQKSFTIPSIEVEVDGKTQTTKPIKVTVQKDMVGSNKAFVFTLEADKKEAYIGEPINVIFTFKKHLGIELAEANFNSPTFHDFWAKPMGKQPAIIEGKYQVYRIKYLLFPQKIGKIKIEPGRMDAAIMQKRKRDFFNFERVKWKSIFTKELEIDVKPLPNGVDIYGNFKMSASVDKTKVKANEPVNLTVSIKGIGNIDDIEEFKLDIKNAIVYADKPQRKIFTNNKEELGEFTQKFAIVSDRNFTIDGLEFSFFDGESEKIKTVKSKPFDIEVVGSLIKTQTAKLQKKEETKQIVPKTKVIYEKASLTQLILSALGGFILGMLSLFLIQRLSNKTEDKIETELPLPKRIKKSKNDKELLSVLLPYTDRSKELKKIIKELEENIYEGKKHKINKQDLVQNINNYLKKDKEIEEILK